MKQSLRLGVAGLGTVGSAVVRMVARRADALAAAGGRDVRIVAVSSRDKGRDRGLDLTGVTWFDDPVALAASPDIDCVVELIGGSEGPARATVEAAIAAGKHVVTANKALLAKHGAALAAAAEAKGVSLAYEASVAGGIPVIKTLREGLPGTGVRFAAGYPLEGSPSAGASAAQLADEAVDAARTADVVLLFLGLPGSYESEGFDREHLDLPSEQLALLDALLEVNDSVVVVLSNGSAVRLHPWADRVPALLEGWLLGQAGGAAVADLLLGVVSPSGRLAETLPQRLEDTPAFGAGFPGEGGVVRYGEGVFIGYRWYDSRRLPVSFPFGHGLTYAAFLYEELDVEVTGSGAGAGLRVGVRVTNTGRRAAAEVVQVYVADPEASVARPDAELKAFARVELEPGESRTASFALDARALSYWSPVQRRWVVEGGAFEVRVGASSRDVRLREVVQVDGEDLTPPVAVDAEISTWLDHPVAGPALRSVLGRSGGGFLGMLDDPGHGAMFRAIPLVRMARFPGFPATEAELEGIADRANTPARP